MTQDIQKFRQLVESAYAANLTEGYEDRVKDLAQKIVNRFGQGQPVSKDQLSTAIRSGINWPLGTVRPETVVKDVVNALKGHLELKKPVAGVALKVKAKKALSHMASYLAHRLVDELGNVFPDGDPHDALENVVRRLLQADPQANSLQRQVMYGYPDVNLQDIKSTDPDMYFMPMQDWVQQVLYPSVHAAFKKDQGVDVYAYLADMWDQYKGDMEYDARQSMQAMQAQGKDVPADYIQKYLNQHGFGHSNPYR